MNNIKKHILFLTVLSMLFSLICTGANAATNITIKNSQTGKTYTAYKMCDVVFSNGEYYVTTVSDEWLNFFGSAENSAYFSIDTDNYLHIQASFDTAAFAQSAGNYADSEGLAMANTTTASGVSASLSLDDGYYLIIGAVGDNKNYITALVPETTVINDKSYEIILDKNTKEGSVWQSFNDAAIGDLVEFRTAITCESNPEDYTLTETLSAGFTLLTESPNTPVVKFKKSSGSESDWDPSYYTLNTDSTSGTIQLTFTDSGKALIDTNDQVILYYSAQLNDSAIIGGSGNVCTTKLTCGSEKTFTRSSSTYSYKITVNKTDGTSPLSGATFVLQKKSGDEYVNVQTISTGTEFVFSGLDAGDYKLIESIAPSGYNPIPDYNFTITAEYNATGITALSANGFTSTPSDGSLSITMVNVKGASLPETGGIGTTVFYISGAVLVLAAMVVLILKNRAAAD